MPPQLVLHERVGVDDRAVDVALGGEVDDAVVAGHGLGHRVPVADVALHEAEAGVVLEVLEVVGVAGVGQGVEDRDLVVACWPAPGGRSWSR